MHATIGSIGSESELLVIAVAGGLACAGGAFWARTRAPAVTVALVTAVVTGVATYWIASAHGPQGAPIIALVSASGAMVASGFVSLWLLPKGGRATSLRPAGLGALVAAPLVGLAALVSIQHACPLYVGRRAGACYYAEDVLGGWSAGAAIVIALDMVFIAVLLLVSDRRLSGAESPRRADAESVRV